MTVGSSWSNIPASGLLIALLRVPHENLSSSIPLLININQNNTRKPPSIPHASTAFTGKMYLMQDTIKQTPLKKTAARKYTGIIQITRQGRGFLIPEQPAQNDITISPYKMGTALPEDRVMVENDRITRVLKRHRTQFVGTLNKGKNGTTVVMDDPRITTPFRIRQRTKIPAGNKVVVDLLSWTSPKAPAQGKIIEDLGPANATGVDMLSVLRQYNLTETFPAAVLKEMKQLSTDVPKTAFKNRIDCRKQPVITIDPQSARDFDDAFSLQRTKNGNWCLRVHIADVSHYVRPGSTLDQEARKRGNSTYLVDRVIPMLPEGLSNELCSLKPKVDRLTKCVEFILNPHGHILKTQFFSAVIHSQKRYSYEEALAVIESTPNTRHEHMIHHAHGLAQKLRTARYKHGGLEMNHASIEIKLDTQGRVKELHPAYSDAAHQLIEEFMLLTNEAVAVRLKHLKQATIYRTHAAPDAERLDLVRKEIMQQQIACGDLSNPIEVQRLFKRLDKHPLGQLLKISYLKVLNRASYSTDPALHHGLAKTPYTHFTSPIRRYADLEVHRSLFEKHPSDSNALTDTASHLSVTERNASAAERDSRTVKLLAFLQRQIDTGKRTRYPATITAIRPAGWIIDIPRLGISSFIPKPKGPEPALGSTLNVMVKDVSLAQKSHRFQPA